MKKLITAIALLAAAPAWAEDKMTVLLDWFINPDHGPIIVAQENGYFADRGWRLKLSRLPTRPHRRVWWLPVRPIWPCPTSRSCTCRYTKACP